MERDALKIHLNKVLAYMEFKIRACGSTVWREREACDSGLPSARICSAPAQVLPQIPSAVGVHMLSPTVLDLVYHAIYDDGIEKGMINVSVRCWLYDEPVHIASTKPRA